MNRSYAQKFFIGQKMWEQGNAATNVAFPLVMIITTLAMTFGTGSSASFSLYLGEKKMRKQNLSSETA